MSDIETIEASNMEQDGEIYQEVVLYSDLQMSSACKVEPQNPLIPPSHLFGSLHML